MNAPLIKWDASSASRSTFTETLGDLEHPLPWHASEDNYGVIQDARGETVTVVDADNQRSDEDAYQLAIWIVTAVNTCGGFTAVIKEMEH